MKITLIFLAFFFLKTLAFSQKKDYKIMRDSITKLSCKPIDSSTVSQTNLELKEIDINLFDQNVDLYYKDLGWSYYRLYLYAKDTSLIRNAINSYLNANTCKPNNSSTLWMLTHLNYMLRECEMGKFFLEKFKSVTAKEYWREEQIKLITKQCSN